MAGSGASNGGGYVVFVPRLETLDWSLLGDNPFGKVEPFDKIHQLNMVSLPGREVGCVGFSVPHSHL